MSDDSISKPNALALARIRYSRAMDDYEKADILFDEQACRIPYAVEEELNEARKQLAKIEREIFHP